MGAGQVSLLLQATSSPLQWEWMFTYKGMGRQKMDEIAVYEVKDGKIVKEQFFY